MYSTCITDCTNSVQFGCGNRLSVDRMYFRKIRSLNQLFRAKYFNLFAVSRLFETNVYTQHYIAHFTQDALRKINSLRAYITFEDAGGGSF